MACPPLPPAECVLLLTTYWPIRVRVLTAAATGSTPLPLPPTAVPFPFPVRYRHALSELSPFRAHCFLPPVFSPAPSAHRIACGTVPLCAIPRCPPPPMSFHLLPPSNTCRLWLKTSCWCCYSCPPLASPIPLLCPPCCPSTCPSRDPSPPCCAPPLVLGTD